MRTGRDTVAVTDDHREDRTDGDRRERPDVDDGAPGGPDAYRPVGVAFARDGTPVFGFETGATRVGEPLAFDFVLLHGDGAVRFAVRAGDRLAVVARERSARRVAERLVEYGEYDVAVSYGEHLRAPGTEAADRYDEVTRHRLDGPAYERLYGAYLELDERG